MTAAETLPFDSGSEAIDQLSTDDRFAHLLPFMHEVVAAEGALHMPPGTPDEARQRQAIKLTLGPETQRLLSEQPPDQLGIVLGGLALQFVADKPKPNQKATAQLCVRQWEQYLQGQDEVAIAGDFNLAPSTIRINRSKMIGRMKSAPIFPGTPPPPSKTNTSKARTELSLLRQEQNPDWPEEAGCRGYDTEIFFPNDGDTSSQGYAKAICGRCEVRQDCLDSALNAGENWGIWGGLTPRERKALLRRSSRVTGQV